MCMLNKRAHILFDKDLWNKLEKMAKAEKISVGNIIRRAAEKEIEKEKELGKRKKAIDLTLMGRILSKGKIDYKELISYGRK